MNEKTKVLSFVFISSILFNISLSQTTTTDSSSDDNNSNSTAKEPQTPNYVVHFYTTKTTTGINGTSLFDASGSFYYKFTNLSISIHKYSTSAEAIHTMLQAPANGLHIAAISVPNVLFYGTPEDPIKTFSVDNLTVININTYSPIVLVSAVYESLDSLLKSAESLGDDEYMNLCSPQKFDAYYLLHKNIQNSHKKIANKLRYTTYSMEENNYTWWSLSSMCAAVYCDMSSALELEPVAHLLGVTAEQSLVDLPDVPIFKNIGINDDRTTFYKGFAVSKNVPEEAKKLLAIYYDDVSKVNKNEY